MGYILCAFVFSMIGFAICSILSMGKIEDLQKENYRLKKENMKLHRKVVEY